MLEQLPVAVAVAVGRLDLAGRVEAHPVLLLALGKLEAVRRAARDDDVVALAERHAPEDRAQNAGAAVHVDDLVALAVSVEALERLGRLRDRDLDVAVPHQQAPARERVTARLDRLGVREPVDVRLRHPLLALDRAERADLVEPAGRLQVEQDRLVAREALVAHHLLDEQRRRGADLASLAAPPLAVLAHLDVTLGWDLSETRVTHQRFPLRSCSRSIASKRALKLPSPKPRAPCRSMISKNTVGRSPMGFVKICRR